MDVNPSQSYLLAPTCAHKREVNLEKGVVGRRHRSVHYPQCCSGRLVKVITMENPVSSAVIAGPPQTHWLCPEFHQHTMIQCFVVYHRLCFHTSNGELLEDTRGEGGGGRYHGTEALCTAGIVMTELF